MSFIYKNPVSGTQLTGSNSVGREKVFGTNFSVLQTGGYMEVYTLNDLTYTIPAGQTGKIEFSGNTIPVNYAKRTLAFLPDAITLNSDNISSGRRRLGMLVYVHETQTTYQYTMPNFEDLWNAASGSTTESSFGTTVTTQSAGGTDFINAWLDSSIEGVSGVTRDEARWRVFYGTDWQITGGTYNSGTGTLSLNNNTGGTINVTGFTTGGGDTAISGITYDNNWGLSTESTDGSSGTVLLPFITGGTYVGSEINLNNALGNSISISAPETSDTYVTGGTYTNATGTLELNRNDGNSINVTGFLTGSTGSQNLQQVLDNGNVSNTGMYISGATLTATTVDINGGYIDGVVLGSVSPVTLTSNSATITGGFINGVVLGNVSPVTLTSNSATITGGFINGVTLGNSTPVTITSNSATITGGFINGVTLGNSTPVTITSNNATITNGFIDGTTIGFTTRATGGFTYIYDNNGSTGMTGQILSTTTTGITWTDSSSTDYYVTGGTLSAQGDLTLTRNDGNTIEITGFTSQESDTYVTGATYTESTGILSLERNDGNNVGVGGWTYVKSITESNNNLSVTLNDGNVSLLGIEAITGLGYNDWGITGSTTGGLLYNGTELPFITGGSYNAGTVTLNINGSVESNIQISGFDSDDTYLTGATYTPTTLTLGMNDGSDFNVGGFAPEITGGTYSNGTLSLDNNTGGSVDITGITFSSTNIYNTDGQLEGDRIIDQDSNNLTFSGGSVSMGTSTTSPVCALLELASTNQGLLIPRMTQVQRLAINSPLPGLLVYCTDSDGNGEEGMYMYKSQGWVNVL